MCTDKITVIVDINIFTDVEIEFIKDDSSDIAGMISHSNMQFSLTPKQKDLKKMNKCLEFAKSIQKEVLQLLIPNRELFLRVKNFYENEKNFYIIAEN